MDKISVFAALLLAASNVRAAAPEYESDPFGDADFANAPLVLDASYPSHRHGELSLLFSGSVVDKYTSHLGGLLDFNYYLFDTLAVGASLGYMHGTLTPIVTDREGIIGNKMQECLAHQEKCSEINPSVPDYRQITGLADVFLMWSPFYGKINVVSEADISLRLYGLLGVGVNGTRTVAAQALPQPRSPDDYALRGNKFLDGGMFANPKLNATVGMGLSLYVLEWLALRAEVRGVMFRDELALHAGNQSQSDISMIWFGQGGLAFTLF